METPEEKQQKKPLTEQEALRKLAALCAKGEHCTGEMLTKMERWGLDEGQQASVMAKLVEGKYVDDERFCRLFIHDKMKFDKWGRRKIEQALWQKRIDPALIKATLDDIDDAEYIAILHPLLQAKQKSIKAQSDYERNMKLIRYALGRGFTFDIIRQCIDNADDYEEQ
ncbi:MAG: RecX family transcriptional regulator [Prevotella sp.]|nr:RecX family transcriptional regulator [Prevotella sp.]MBQ6210044.1 RecX family transcriptional regulator [Prevotella sp.]